MSYFPFFIDVQDKAFLVVGGGRIAYRKVEVLSQFEVKINVTAAKICEEISVLKNISDEGNDLRKQILLNEREFVDDDIFTADYVVAATDDEKLNSYIAELCRKNNKLVNVVDVKEECSFVFPAIIKKEELVIAVSTGGNSPAMAAEIKRKIQSEIPDYYGELIECLGLYREYIKSNVDLPENRIKVYKELIGLAELQEGNVTFEQIQNTVTKYS
jgi:siroheme synthase-like protein